MSDKYVGECISCGVEEEFKDLAELQKAIISGGLGEYVCSDCAKDKVVIVDE
ncbi:hypothetical protein [Dethiobacter alkaliphilus]|uniref:hypothetical protein n=1 Tax=Dethiobacter alkaliphilus TaxID=427926 RepID=UPI00222796B2|nr:hypothetical protein [Dethiobacter alkaliphilus]MCW3489516.1 hypothetical protein [Dethiobacter alkaliphilus]